MYLQPARAENTVTFKMVILPAEENVVKDIAVDPFRKFLFKNDTKFQLSQFKISQFYKIM